MKQTSTRIKAIIVLATLILAGAWTLDAARGANPSSATYSKDPSAVFWIMHISDSHIGASTVEGPNASAHLTWALGEGVDTINPVLVVATGDLCDGSRNNIPALGQDQGEWDDYSSIVSTAGMTVGFYLDLPGNHDGYDDMGLTYYLANSLNGQDQGVPWREIVLSLPFGDYVIFGLNTAGDGSGPFVESAEYTADEIAALQTSMQTYSTADLALLFGHHRINQPAESADVITAAQQAEAFYFHGHLHDYGSYFDNGIVNAQVDTLGKGDSNNLAVIAVDNNALSYVATSSDDPWPMVVITTPADRLLGDSSVSPYAYEVCNTATDNPVRALVFDVDTVTGVAFEAGGAAPVAMVQDAVEPRLWHGTWDTSGLPAGETTLTVTAAGSATKSHSVSVMLADVSCPPDVVTPDAGVVPDAGSALDAGTTPDANTPTEDASTTGTDGSVNPPNASDDGCNCQTRGSGPVPLLPLLLVVGLLALLRRRR